MSKLYIMIGCPGAGKSTWCKNNLPDNVMYISRDIIRYSMVNKNEEYFSKENQVYREFVDQINQALKMGIDVCADQTSIDRAARAKLLKQVRPNASELIAVWLNPSIETILKQNALRSGRQCVPEHAIQNMYARMEAPTFEEGFIEILTIDEGSTELRHL